MKVLSFYAALVALLLSACTANNGQITVNKIDGDDKSLYTQKGMEVASEISQMADLLYKTLINDYQNDTSRKVVDYKGNVSQDLTLPRVAITTFVDTDTYQDAGYLGRSLSELFVHEFDRRGLKVFEYKLTGTFSITKDGEYIFSRDWKKLARQAMVKNVFAGTVTRNDEGVILVGRIIDMETQLVQGSTTGFIPYKHLPTCYQSATKTCDLKGISSYSKYSTTGQANILNYKAQALSASERRALKEQQFKDNYYRTDSDEFNSKYYVKGAKVPATSTGNYEEYMYRKGQFLNIGNGSSPVIYPATSYQYGEKLVRDIHDQSQYSRTRD